VAVFFPFAQLDVDAHPFAVDVDFSKAGDFCDAHARPVAGGHDGLVLEEFDGLKDGQHLFSAQHHGKPFGKFGAAQIFHDFRTLQDFSVEKLQGADIGFLHGGTGVFLCGQMEQEAFDFLLPHLGRGTHEVFGKPAATA